MSSRATRSRLSLTDQRILQLETILASFVQKHVINIVNKTLVHIISLITVVTTCQENTILSPKQIHSGH
jgi:hypothetical protein